MSALCYPTYTPLRKLKDLGLEVVEIGAGDGEWARALRKRNVSTIAFDINPQSDNVKFGSHIDASAHNDKAMLAVWPPDGDEIQEWIEAAEWPAIAIVGCWERFDVGDTLRNYDLSESIDADEGVKGKSEMRIYLNKQIEDLV